MLVNEVSSGGDRGTAVSHISPNSNIRPFVHPIRMYLNSLELKHLNLITPIFVQNGLGLKEEISLFSTRFVRKHARDDTHQAQHGTRMPHIPHSAHTPTPTFYQYPCKRRWILTILSSKFNIHTKYRIWASRYHQIKHKNITNHVPEGLKPFGYVKLTAASRSKSRGATIWNHPRNANDILTSNNDDGRYA